MPFVVFQKCLATLLSFLWCLVRPQSLAPFLIWSASGAMTAVSHDFSLRSVTVFANALSRDNVFRLEICWLCSLLFEYFYLNISLLDFHTDDILWWPVLAYSADLHSKTQIWIVWKFSNTKSQNLRSTKNIVAKLGPCVSFYCYLCIHIKRCKAFNFKTLSVDKAGEKEIE